MNVFSVFGRIGMDAENYEAGLRAAEQSTVQTGRAIKQGMGGAVESLDKRLGNLGSSLEQTGRAITPGLTGGITALMTLMVGATTRLGNYADGLLDMAEQTGLSTDRLQEFENVAREAGVASDTLGRAAEGLTRRLRATGPGAAGFEASVEAIGVSTRDTTGRLRSMDDLMPELIQNLSQVENTTERNALAMQIFGRAGTNLIPVLALSSERIAELGEEAHEMGQVLGSDALNAANDFRISQEQLRAEVGLLGREITVSVMPIAQSFITMIREQIVPRVRAFTQAIVSLVEWIQSLAGWQQRALGGLVIALAATGPLMMAMGRLIRTVTAIRTAFIALRTAAIAMRASLVAMALPITILVVGIVALYQAWQRNLFGIQDVTRQAAEYIGNAWNTVVGFGQALIENWETVAWGWGQILESMRYMTSHVGESIAAAWEVSTLKVQQFFASMFRAIESMLRGAINGIVGAINALVGRINQALGWAGADIQGLGEVTLDAWAGVVDDLEGRITSAMERVGAAHAGIEREVGNVRSIVVAVATVIETSMAKGATAVEAVEEAAEDLGMTFEEVMDLLETGTTSLNEAVGKATDDTEKAVEGSLANLREQLSEAMQEFENAADDAGREAAWSLVTQLLEAIEEIEAMFRDADLTLPVRVVPVPDLSIDYGGRTPSAPGATAPGDFTTLGPDDPGVPMRGMPGPHRPIITPPVGVEVDDAVNVGVTPGVSVPSPVPVDGVTGTVNQQRVRDRMLREQNRRNRLAAQAQRDRWNTEGATEDFHRRMTEDPRSPAAPIPVPEISQTPTVDVASGVSIIVDILEPEVDRLGEFLGEVGEGLKFFGETLLEQIPLIGDVFTAMQAGVNPMQALFGAISGLVVNSEAFQELLQLVNEALAPLIDNIVKPLVEVLTVLLNALWPVIEVIFALIETALQPLIAILTHIVAPVFTFVARLIATIWNAIARALNALLGWLGVNLRLIDLDGDDALTRPDDSPIEDPFGDPAADPEMIETASFNRTPQAVQLAVATPLVEASYRMLDAAEQLNSSLSALLPRQGASFEAIPPFTNALERLTPLLERLLSEGVEIRVASETTTQASSPTAYLRGY